MYQKNRNVYETPPNGIVKPLSGLCKVQTTYMYAKAVATYQLFSPVKSIHANRSASDLLKPSISRPAPAVAYSPTVSRCPQVLGLK